MIIRKDGLYVALKCLDRMRLHLKQQGGSPGLGLFLDSLWQILKGSKTTASVSKAEREIDKLMVDEQEAGFEQCLLNKYYYAVSDLIMFIKEGDPLSVDCALEEALEFYRYDAANDYMLSLGGDAMILTAADEEKIESDDRVVFEKEHQLDDKRIACSTSDWSSVFRDEIDNHER